MNTPDTAEPAAQVAYTLYSTCTGTPVLAIEADPETAAQVAELLGHRPWARCGQCGDTNYTETTLDAGEITGANLDEYTVVPAAEIAELIDRDDTAGM